MVHKLHSFHLEDALVGGNCAVPYTAAKLKIGGESVCPHNKTPRDIIPRQSAKCRMKKKRSAFPVSNASSHTFLVNSSYITIAFMHVLKTLECLHGKCLMHSLFQRGSSQSFARENCVTVARRYVNAGFAHLLFNKRQHSIKHIKHQTHRRDELLRACNLTKRVSEFSHCLTRSTQHHVPASTPRLIPVAADPDA